MAALESKTKASFSQTIEAYFVLKMNLLEGVGYFLIRIIWK